MTAHQIAPNRWERHARYCPCTRCALALAAGAQSAETNKDLAQSEGRQSGGSASERNAQTPSQTPPGTYP
jgi:hypothetical protein